MTLSQAQRSSKFCILYNFGQFLARKGFSSVSYPVSLWLPPQAASPAAGCPFWLRPTTVLSGVSPPSARPHSAGRAESAGAPQTFPAAHRSLPLAAAGPGNADVEPPEEPSNLDTLQDKGRRSEYTVKRRPRMHFKCNEWRVGRTLSTYI